MTQSGVRRSGTESAAPRARGSALWRLKVRLQFTGWLQYLPTVCIALAFALVAAAGWVIGAWPVILFWLPAGAASLLLVTFVFDLVTVKLGLHPVEAVPERRDGLGAFDLMRARRSCRSFQSRDLAPAHRTELMESVRAHTRPDRLIGSSPVRMEYIAAPLTVWPVVGAHEFLVAIAPRTYDRLAVVDVGRSLQKVVLDATRMGLATCWIGPGADQKSVVQHLGDRFDPEKDHVICVCAVGYRSRFMPSAIRAMQTLQHRRLPLASLFFADPHFREPLDVTRFPWEAYGRCYEVCQWAPSSFNGQTTRCAAVVEPNGGEERPVRFDFCASTTSRYYAPVALGIWCANWETGCQELDINGHFAVLSPGERGVQGAPELPRYDVSWVVDHPATT
ncbi:nitroreductase [Streptomyces pluripotens]|uniref:Nitroreductase n=1 Tax=Streptomyces pluripotens TaxID=1355015 RepID=A0A221NU18_9ACTN|nr:nitroreductase [Streptomyces pluripotens]ASN23035.1 nitroreductase [Streptomyces pluripotens]